MNNDYSSNQKVYLTSKIVFLKLHVFLKKIDVGYKINL